MRKLAIAAIAALTATVGTLGTVSVAEARDRGDREIWRKHDGGNRHAGRHWRHGHHKWKRHHWRHGHRHGPRVVFRSHWRGDYCFVKKVRRYDDWGNMYIKRVRICR